MKKNIRDYKVNGAQYAYLLDEVLTYDGEPLTDAEKVAMVCREFSKHYLGYSELYRRKYGYHQMLSEWIAGMPTGVHIDYDDYSILKLGKSWGFCKNERSEERFVSNWFDCIATRIQQLAEYFEDDVKKIFATNVDKLIEEHIW